MSRSIESRTVLIDMDSTLFDFDGKIKLELAARGIAYADPSLDFYIAKRYTDPEVIDFIHSVQNAEGFFQNLEPLPEAIEKWYQMQEMGYHPRICSKPLRANPYCTTEKLAAVEHYFGLEAAAEAYIGGDKESEPGIALFDDRPGLGNGKTWQRVIFSQPWNQHESGMRLESWQDPRLPSILAQCAGRYDRLFGH